MAKRKCKHCKSVFEKKRLLQYICSPTCAIAYNRFLADKKEGKERKEKLEKLLPVSTLKKKLESEINHIVRIVDDGLPCISCGTLTGKWNAGHYHSVGSNDTIRFHLDNIHKQCFQCNHHKSANIIGYDRGLEDRYGNEYFEKVKYSLLQIQEIKLSRSEIEELISKSRRIKKELLSGKEYSRDDINTLLAIYIF